MKGTHLAILRVCDLFGMVNLLKGRGTSGNKCHVTRRLNHLVHPSKINMSSNKGPFQRESRLPTIIFSGPMLVVGGTPPKNQQLAPERHDGWKTNLSFWEGDF